MVVPCLSKRAPTRLCHDTVYCIVTQNREWAVAHPVASDQVFFSIHATEKTTQKNIFFILFFIFLFPVNQINLLKFILFYFSSSFTHCKTLEKFLHIIFFSFNLDHFVQNSRTPKVIFLGPSVQRFLLCYSPNIQIIHNNSCSHIQAHITQCMQCSNPIP